jgi:RimJ/RimL family protein N-acetyltransferase
MTHNLWEDDLVRLRAIEPKDWTEFHRNDLDTEAARMGYRVFFPRSAEGTRKWAEEQSTAVAKDDNYLWAIESLPGHMLVGTINTHGCDRLNGTFEYGISIFRDHWGKGYAGGAIGILLRYYFKELGYAKANVTVVASNEQAKRLHEKLGFTQEGRIRSNVFLDGERHDELWFGMTAAEFRERWGTGTGD